MVGADNTGTVMSFRPITRPRVAAIVLGAGSGTRVGGVHNKVFLPLAGRRVLSWSFHALAQVRSIDRFIMVIRENDRELAEQTVDREIEDIDVEIVVGGASRHESELLALRHLGQAIRAGEINIALIHDGARPLLSPQLVRTLISVAAEHGAVFPGLESHDIRYLRDDGTIDFSQGQRMVAAQTPQVFDAHTLLTAYEKAAADGFVGTDTAACVSQYSEVGLQWVPGDTRNIKITYPNDLFTAANILRDQQFRIE